MLNITICSFLIVLHIISWFRVYRFSNKRGENVVAKGSTFYRYHNMPQAFKHLIRILTCHKQIVKSFISHKNIRLLGFSKSIKENWQVESVIEYKQIWEFSCYLWSVKHLKPHFTDLNLAPNSACIGKSPLSKCF